MILGVKWFSGKNTIGVVKVADDMKFIKYFMGVASGKDEEADKQDIADTGTKLPYELGEQIFKY